MIRRAIERGVSPERLAAALDVDPSTILKKVSLLDGVCSEAVDLLKDQHFSPHMGTVLRKLKPTRQIECVELMLAASNFSVAYAEALVAASPPDLLVSGKRPKWLSGLSAEQMAKMEREMGNLKGQLKLAEQSYGQDVLNLVLAKAIWRNCLRTARFPSSFPVTSPTCWPNSKASCRPSPWIGSKCRTLLPPARPAFRDIAIDAIETVWRGNHLPPVLRATTAVARRPLRSPRRRVA